MKTRYKKAINRLENRLGRSWKVPPMFLWYLHKLQFCERTRRKLQKRHNDVQLMWIHEYKCRKFHEMMDKRC